MKNKILLIPLVLLLAMSLVASACPAPPPPAPPPPAPAPAPAPPKPPPPPPPKPPEVIKAKFSTWAGPTTVWGRGDTLCASLINEKLAGRFELEMFPSSSLYTHEELLAPLRTGAVEFGEVTAMMMESWDERASLFPLPLLWPDWETLHSYVNSPAGKKVLATIEDKANSYCLPFLQGSGWHHLWAYKRIESLDDFKGENIACWMSSQMKLCELLGASAGRQSVTECYAAMASKQFRMQFCSIGSGPMYGLPEFTPHCTLQGFNNNIGYWMVNKDFWDGLPQDIKKVITDEVCPEVDKFFYEAMTVGDEKLMEEYTAKWNTDFYSIPDAVWAEIVEAGGRSLWEEYRPLVGEEIYTDALKACGW